MHEFDWQTLKERRTASLNSKLSRGRASSRLHSAPHRVSKYCHSMTVRQLYTGKDSYKYSFFLLPNVQWNAFPEKAVTSQSLDSYKVEGAAPPQILDTYAFSKSEFIGFSSVPSFKRLIRPSHVFYVSTFFSIRIFNIDSLSRLDQVPTFVFAHLVFGNVSSRVKFCNSPFSFYLLNSHFINITYRYRT